MTSYDELYKNAAKAKTTHSMEPLFLRLEKKGDSVVGRLLGVVNVKARVGNGSFNMYTLETDKGNVKIKIGAASDKSIGALLTPGMVYRFEFLGKDKLPEGNEVNRWDVQEVPEK